MQPWGACITGTLAGVIYLGNAFVVVFKSSFFAKISISLQLGHLTSQHCTRMKMAVSFCGAEFLYFNCFGFSNCSKMSNAEDILLTMSSRIFSDREHVFGLHHLMPDGKQ